MRLLISYLKEKLPVIGVYAVMLVIFCILLWLKEVPFDVIGYGAELSAIWLLFVGALNFWFYRKRYQSLLDLSAALPHELKEFPDPKSRIEAEYQEITETIFAWREMLENEVLLSKKDASDYYSLWVHQIKIPIAAMHILLQSVEDKNPALPELKEMKMELFKMEQYVEMVLTYLRMEDMSGDLQFEKVSLDKILKQSVRKYSQMFILQKIRLDYRPVERIVLTDEKWLEFVTEQILSNALKYTKNGGEIRICLEEKRGRECLVIEDNGIGIQAEDLPRVFEKGFTGYNGRADKKSTGIGLYLCKKIMDKMGHKIWIDSEVGKGTRVYLELTRKEWNPE